MKKLYTMHINGNDITFNPKEFADDIYTQNIRGIEAYKETYGYFMPYDYWNMVNEFEDRYLHDENFKAFVKAVQWEYNDLICLNEDALAFMYGVYGIRIPWQMEISKEE